MCIGIFSFRAFDRRLARLAAPISSGVRQGGQNLPPPPPAGRVRLNTPAGRGLRLVKTLCRTMEKKLEEVHFWSDSMDVLCWIRNEVRRFQPFVAHRVSEIRERTTPEQWQHVSGTDNPADAPTRGLSLNNLKESQLWWEGPKFLLGNRNQWPRKKEFATAEYDQFDQSELKKDQQKNVFAVRAPSLSSSRLNPANFSGWTRLIRVTAWVQRFIRVLREKASRTSIDPPSSELSPEELEAAEKFWVEQAQKDSFRDEVDQLQRAKTSGTRTQKTCRRSAVKQLSPFLDDDGIIRVGGRLQRSELSFEAKHPMLLPKNHAVSKLVIQHIHAEAEHGMGIEHTLAELRTIFWIPAAREMIKSCIRRCVTCQKLQKKPEVQEMAPMTNAQVQPSLRAFDKCAVDYAGPFLTKQGRGKTRQKRYLCIFVCLQTKASHLELAYSLDTTSFIRALMRFISRRGCPTEIRSANGRNFVRAAKELKKEVQELDSDEIQRELSKHRIRWIFNPPGAPHFNGVCEALVRVAKKALVKTLERADLTDEELHTAFCRAEGLLNSRPLTPVSSDPNDLPPLTPGDFITGPSRVELKPTTSGSGCSLRQRWRRLQQLNTEFWRRWMRGYLPTLQARHKWTEVRRNLQEGEVVLLLDPHAPRGTWPMARVEKTYPGPDGLVRVVDVKTSKGLYKRPVTKIIRLEMEQ